MEAATRIVRYIKQSPGMGILMSSVASTKLQAYCDADWGSCLTTRRSISGYVVKLGNSLISWKSKKQPTFLGARQRQSTEVLLRQLRE